MPLYEVFHVIPLSRQQKDALAGHITDLHSIVLTTPRFFVNVRFEQIKPAGDLYAAGKHRGNTAPNHILVTTRVSAARTKEVFDQMSLKLIAKWNDVVVDAALGASSLEHLGTKEQKQAKSLKAIVFKPMLAVLENGLLIPAPGDEKTWLKDNLAYFQEQANEHDDADFKEMLEEIDERAGDVVEAKKRQWEDEAMGERKYLVTNPYAAGRTSGH